ncbi:plant/K7P8-3 protein [Senna tora]|uniref:Plant/K7P8-3 protein n=1 Tax=Senna tora TaxID=362788 RepID=A0A834TPI1_9FABA|nr:plant/K7P8-3 protein [Senna tora]
MTGVKRRLCSDSDIHALHKELDEVSCPICMDHPHNAVLLLCSSHDKGCRSYICDTSYRHSNCLDRFKKLQANSKDSSNLPSSLVNTNNSGSSRQGDIQDSSRHFNPHNEGILETVDSETLQDRTELEELDVDNSPESKLSLKCPLCRGTVLGWEVVEEARNYLNLKKRSCSRESCSFVGNYLELRRHARRVHPTTRPSDVDPSRERAWRHLERQREYGDIVSAVRSAMPGAVVMGDYVIENGDGRFSGEREGGMGDSNGPLWTTLFLFQMIGSIEGAREPRPRSRAWTRYRRPAGAGGSSDRRYLWGENLLGLNDNDIDEDLRIFNEAGEDASPIPRRRRRLTRSRSNGDRS